MSCMIIPASPFCYVRPFLYICLCIFTSLLMSFKSCLNKLTTKLATPAVLSLMFSIMFNSCSSIGSKHCCWVVFEILIVEIVCGSNFTTRYLLYSKHERLHNFPMSNKNCCLVFTNTCHFCMLRLYDELFSFKIKRNIFETIKYSKCFFLCISHFC